MLTVVFATRNRGHLLGRVLDALAGLSPPRGGWTLIAVDNGSTDATLDVLRSFNDRLPLTILTEARPGMNAALNAALPHIAGDLMVKGDDDILPSPCWLRAYRAAADRQPRATLFGGTVEPEWPHDPPHWLVEAAVPFSVLYAQCRRAGGACPLHDIYGPNWAVRAAVFADGTRFNEGFGPDATRGFYRMGGETELFARLARRGDTGWFVPDARVRHIIRAEQLREEWILDRSFRYGRGAALLHPPRWASRPGALRARLAAYRAASWCVRPLPPSPWRLKLRYRERFLSGLAAARREPLPA